MSAVESGGILEVRQDSLGEDPLAGPALGGPARADGPLTSLCNEREVPA